MVLVVVLPADASDDDILGLAQRWIEALSQGDYRGAVLLTTDHGNERAWPPNLIAEVITSYESPEAPGPGRVTLPESARGEPPHPRLWEVNRWPRPRARPEVIGAVECDLPINGVWSDLTALFWLRRVPEGLALELYDLHIL